MNLSVLYPPAKHIFCPPVAITYGRWLSRKVLDFNLKIISLQPIWTCVKQTLSILLSLAMQSNRGKNLVWNWLPLNRKIMLISHKMEKNSQSIFFLIPRIPLILHPLLNIKYESWQIGTGNSEAHREAARVNTLSPDAKFIANTNIIIVPFWWYAAFFWWAASEENSLRIIQNFTNNSLAVSSLPSWGEHISTVPKRTLKRKLFHIFSSSMP